MPVMICVERRSDSCHNKGMSSSRWIRTRILASTGTVTLMLVFACASSSIADLPRPTLSTIYPPGGQRGSSFDIELAGGSLEGCKRVRISVSGVRFEHIDGLRFRATIGKDVPVGLYDVQAVGDYGISSTRSFTVSGLADHLETETVEGEVTSQGVELGTVCTGKIHKPGDLDAYRFTATKGSTVVIECWAERIDSSLRATLELYDPAGKRVAVSRGFFGKDPLIAYRVLSAGDYTARIADLVFAGSDNHYYRLDIHSGPRVAFTIPTVVQCGRTTGVSVYGWNLGEDSTATGISNYEVVTHQVLAVEPFPTLPVRRMANAVSVQGVALTIPGADAPVLVQTTVAPVFHAPAGNDSQDNAMQLDVPSDASGQIAQPDQASWFSLDLRRGEVVHLELFAARCGSPVDLTLNILSPDGKEILATFTDTVSNVGDLRFPTSHLDPAGRWSAPDDGRYLVVVRNVIGGAAADPRRVYRLCVRRETTPFEVVAIAPLQSPSSLVLRRGGRELFDLLLVRRRGFNGGIQVRAIDLPEGMEIADTWFAPGVTRIPLVVSAGPSMADGFGAIRLQARYQRDGINETREVQGGTMVRTGLPNGMGRLASDIPWSVAGDSPIRLTVTSDRTRYTQGSVMSVQVIVDRADNQAHRATVLTGVGLPPLVSQRLGEIAEGEKSGYISFFLPPTLPTGMYTIAVTGNTPVSWPDPADKSKSKDVGVLAVSNPITFSVDLAPYIVRVNLDAPKKIKRGEIIQLNYTAVRQNGFIGKIHTVIAAPGGVVGLRARGVTFVGQTESGVLQVIANEDAPLGQQRGLRLEGVGTVEDEPVFLGGCFLNLEIIE